MSPFDLLNHLLNFAAPALAMVVLVTLSARWFTRKGSGLMPLWRQLVVNFLATATVLVLGLWFFGHDGKMATYLGMALVCGSSQWLMQRGWRA